MSRRVRPVVSFFDHSATAAHILQSKQEIRVGEFNVPKHKFSHGVPSSDVMERYVEQQAAVCSLTERAFRTNKDITTLSDQDVSMAKEVAKVLKTLKALPDVH